MLAFALGLIALFVEPPPLPTPAELSPDTSPLAAPNASGDERLKCFVAAYPGVVCGADKEGLTLCATGSHAALGAHVPWDDGRRDKPYQDRLEHADLEDTVQMRYRPGRDFAVPDVNFEPGRIRDDAFLQAMYGDSGKAVERRTELVDWMPRSGGKPVRVTSVNGVAKALARVSEDLERELPDDLKQLVAKTAGVFYWRTVRGQERRSPHSYAIAIDVGVARSDYWDWKKPDAEGHYAYKNRFPPEVAAIFERHGFVWGGKWYHFDTMHFEYRPELLVAPCVDGPSPLRTLGGEKVVTP